MPELSPKYDPKEVEERWYRLWEERGDFACDPESRKPAYSIVIPPPNVTGSLHIGHALNNTLQDLLSRWKRMQGYDVLWVPGCDHAGIATQNVVERELAKEGKKRDDLGREKFLERVWQWKEQSGSTIMRQLRRLGASVDWDYERFTMDPGLSEAVQEAFIQLYDKGLIYQGDYIVNWCPRCGTALSDIEAEHKENPGGKLYHIQYAVKGQPGHFVTVATTRPETIPGDEAVAVNPHDARYGHLKGATLILPLFGKEIPLLMDEYVTQDFGTGALKITPAHDANDFLIGEKFNLGKPKIMDPTGTMNELAGKYKGLDRFAARKAIVADLEAAGLLAKVEDYPNSVAKCYRCGTVVESYLSKQWFLKMKPLAAKAIEALNHGQTTFQPANWTKVYSDWLHAMRDWCISRQIWWGHRVPVYNAPDGRQAAGRDAAEAAKKLDVNEKELVQETDVLDTWFSSGLWPFSTLGWPDKTKELQRYFPTSTLVTSWDILFFWVARMSCFSLELTGQVPFKTVLINSLVADEHGQKMSKSKGNVIDPLLKIDAIGADALRLGLCTIESQSRYISLSEERLETARNFTNKVWNAARFMLMNLQGLPAGELKRPTVGLQMADRWILARLDLTTGDVTRFLEDGVQVNQASEALTHFFWDELCDWYIEAVKSRLTGTDAASKLAAQQTLAFVLEQTLRLLHPFCPFITEEIWQLLPHEGVTILKTSWPKAPASVDQAALDGFGAAMEVVRSVRNIRAEKKVDLKREVRALIAAPAAVLPALRELQPVMESLAKMKVESLGESVAAPKGAAAGLAGSAQVFLPLEGLVDLGEEKARMLKEQGKLEGLLVAQKKKLENEAFVSKAPPKLIEAERAKVGELEASIAKLQQALKDLGA
jgi:valyl-tRNA synthetase